MFKRKKQASSSIRQPPVAPIVQRRAPKLGVSDCLQQAQGALRKLRALNPGDIQAFPLLNEIQRLVQQLKETTASFPPADREAWSYQIAELEDDFRELTDVVVARADAAPKPEPRLASPNVSSRAASTSTPLQPSNSGRVQQAVALFSRHDGFTNDSQPVPPMGLRRLNTPQPHHREQQQQQSAQMHAPSTQQQYYHYNQQHPRKHEQHSDQGYTPVSTPSGSVHQSYIYLTDEERQLLAQKQQALLIKHHQYLAQQRAAAQQHDAAGGAAVGGAGAPSALNQQGAGAHSAVQEAQQPQHLLHAQCNAQQQQLQMAHMQDQLQQSQHQHQYHEQGVPSEYGSVQATPRAYSTGVSQPASAVLSPAWSSTATHLAVGAAGVMGGEAAAGAGAHWQGAVGGGRGFGGGSLSGGAAQGALQQGAGHAGAPQQLATEAAVEGGAGDDAEDLFSGLDVMADDEQQPQGQPASHQPQPAALEERRAREQQPGGNTSGPAAGAEMAPARGEPAHESATVVAGFGHGRGFRPADPSRPPWMYSASQTAVRAEVATYGQAPGNALEAETEAVRGVPVAGASAATEPTGYGMAATQSAYAPEQQQLDPAQMRHPQAQLCAHQQLQAGPRLQAQMLQGQQQEQQQYREQQQREPYLQHASASDAQRQQQQQGQQLQQAQHSHNQHQYPNAPPAAAAAATAAQPAAAEHNMSQPQYCDPQRLQPQHPGYYGDTAAVSVDVYQPAPAPSAPQPSQGMALAGHASVPSSPFANAAAGNAGSHVASTAAPAVATAAYPIWKKTSRVRLGYDNEVPIEGQAELQRQGGYQQQQQQLPFGPATSAYQAAARGSAVPTGAAIAPPEGPAPQSPGALHQQHVASYASAYLPSWAANQQEPFKHYPQQQQVLQQDPPQPYPQPPPQQQQSTHMAVQPSHPLAGHAGYTAAEPPSKHPPPETAPRAATLYAAVSSSAGVHSVVAGAATTPQRAHAAPPASPPPHQVVQQGPGDEPQPQLQPPLLHQQLQPQPWAPGANPAASCAEVTGLSQVPAQEQQQQHSVHQGQLSAQGAAHGLNSQWAVPASEQLNSYLNPQVVPTSQDRGAQVEQAGLFPGDSPYRAGVFQGQQQQLLPDRSEVLQGGEAAAVTNQATQAPNDVTTPSYGGSTALVHQRSIPKPDIERAGLQVSASTASMHGPTAHNTAAAHPFPGPYGLPAAPSPSPYGALPTAAPSGGAQTSPGMGYGVGPRRSLQLQRAGSFHSGASDAAPHPVAVQLQSQASPGLKVPFAGTAAAAGGPWSGLAPPGSMSHSNTLDGAATPPSTLHATAAVAATGRSPSATPLSPSGFLQTAEPATMPVGASTAGGATPTNRAPSATASLPLPCSALRSRSRGLVSIGGLSAMGTSIGGNSNGLAAADPSAALPSDASLPSVAELETFLNGITGPVDACRTAAEQRVRDMVSALAGALSQAQKVEASVQQQRRAVKVALASVAASIGQLEADQAAAVDSEDFETAATLDEQLTQMTSRRTNLDEQARALAAVVQQAAALRLEVLGRQAEALRITGVYLARLQGGQQQMAAALASQADREAQAATMLHRAAQETLLQRRAALAERQSELGEAAAVVAAKVAAATAPAEAERQRRICGRDALQAEVESLRALLAAKETALAEAEDAVGEAAEAVRQQAAAYDRDMACLEETRVLLEAEEAQVAGQENALQESERQAAARAAAVEEHQSQLRVQADALGAASASLRLEAEGLVQRVEAEARGLEQRERLLQADEAARQELVALERCIADLSSDLSRLADQRGRLAAERAAAQEGLASLQRSMPELEAAKRAAAASKDFREAARLSGELRALTAQADVIAGQLARLSAALSELAVLEGSKVSELEELRAMTHEAQRRAAEAHHRYLVFCLGLSRAALEQAVGAELYEEAGALQAEVSAEEAEALVLERTWGFSRAQPQAQQQPEAQIPPLRPSHAAGSAGGSSAAALLAVAVALPSTTGELTASAATAPATSTVPAATGPLPALVQGERGNPAGSPLAALFAAGSSPRPPVSAPLPRAHAPMDSPAVTPLAGAGQPPAPAGHSPGGFHCIGPVGITTMAASAAGAAAMAMAVPALVTAGVGASPLQQQQQPQPSYTQQEQLQPHGACLELPHGTPQPLAPAVEGGPAGASTASAAGTVATGTLQGSSPDWMLAMQRAHPQSPSVLGPTGREEDVSRLAGGSPGAAAAIATSIAGTAAGLLSDGVRVLMEPAVVRDQGELVADGPHEASPAHPLGGAQPYERQAAAVVAPGCDNEDQEAGLSGEGGGATGAVSGGGGCGGQGGSVDDHIASAANRTLSTAGPGCIDDVESREDGDAWPGASPAQAGPGHHINGADSDQQLHDPHHHPMRLTLLDNPMYDDPGSSGGSHAPGPGPITAGKEPSPLTPGLKSGPRDGDRAGEGAGPPASVAVTAAWTAAEGAVQEDGRTEAWRGSRDVGCHDGEGDRA